MASIFVNGSTLKKAALDALKRGWSIIPLNRDKLPHFVLTETGHCREEDGKTIPSWKCFQTQRPTPDEVKYWCTGNRDQMIAVVCGEISGIVVLDFDGPSGRTLLKTLKLSPHVRTGSGGFHVYFRHPGYRISTLSGKSKTDLPEHLRSLDIRADGGTAVLPPSSSKRGPYQLLRPFEELEDLRALPGEILEWFNLTPPVPAPTPQTARPSLPRQTRAKEQQERQVDPYHLLSEAVNRAPAGRNNAGFWLACQLRDNDVTLQDAQTLMELYVDNVAHLTGGNYTLSEAISSLHSAYRGQKREKWYTRW